MDWMVGYLAEEVRVGRASPSQWHNPILRGLPCPFLLSYLPALHPFPVAGRRRHVCPYYAARRALPDADIILAPYSALLVKVRSPPLTPAPPQPPPPHPPPHPTPHPLPHPTPPHPAGHARVSGASPGWLRGGHRRGAQPGGGDQREPQRGAGQGGGGGGIRAAGGLLPQIQGAAGAR
jgi:hypothetical protein